MSDAARTFLVGGIGAMIGIGALVLALPWEVWRWTVGVPALLIALGTLYVGPPMHRASADVPGVPPDRVRRELPALRSLRDAHRLVVLNVAVRGHRPLDHGPAGHRPDRR
jgi:hypothetical protein